MANIRTKKQFEKKFKEAVTNFDERKIWFEYKGPGYYPIHICFVWKDKLSKLEMYKSDESIEIWKNYFTEFLETGEFDYNAYFKIYSAKKKDDIVYKFPMRKFHGNDFFPHSEEMHGFLQRYRHMNGDCGIKQVPKPAKV